jgi:hypothetical protein
VGDGCYDCKVVGLHAVLERPFWTAFNALHWGFWFFFLKKNNIFFQTELKDM